MFSVVLVCIVILQRLIELWIAQKNERWILQQGGYEVGAKHYPFMLVLHSSFFLFLLLEILYIKRTLSAYWGILFICFLCVQLVRVWCLFSLGRFWNTKILVLPSAQRVSKGPYKFIRHPNYVIVTIELLVLPLLLNAYYTAIIFSILNLWMLSVRIPIEEKALIDAEQQKIPLT
ncbi:MAG TPA: isoprenylcysteine carboxylmethyltransferase family protein [Sporosarcina sp.]|nr:isoprenylcysteine carboxylmethyltransferase family protein [Sporosarcina sp.]